ncbi:putative ABC transporter FUM19 [Seiridium cardinale]
MELHGLNVSYKRDTADIAFGPERDDVFDFTLLFEQSILGILPSALFILVSIARVTSLWQVKTCVRAGWLLWAKLAAATTLVCLHIALVALWALPGTVRTPVSLAGSVLNLIGSFAIVVLSYTEHRRSIRPSTLLVSYLALSILLDLAQTRTLFLRSPDSGPIQALFTASLATKLALVCLEELQKRPLVTDKTKNLALEATSGPINRSVFWWLNQLFLRGFKSLLQVRDLGSIGNKFDSAKLLAKLDVVWQVSDRGGKHVLIKAAFSAFKVAFLAPVVPRLCLAGFGFAQPFLINRVVSFVGDSDIGTDQRNAGGNAGGLIGATCLVYLGLALSRVIYNHLIFQLITILRGSLVPLIFKKTINLDTTSAKEGAAVTLMSTDVDGIATAIQQMHEIWASVVELAVAVYLLERQIGPACFLVVIPAVVSIIATNYATDGIGPARAMWNQAVQKRVSSTSSMLSQIKGLKMMGLTDYIAKSIQGLRASELELSKRFRAFIVKIVVIANFSDQLTPAVVITAAVFWTKSGTDAFSVSEAFTALSIVALVASPMANLMGSIPNFKASVACFDRIQAFLVLESHEDKRIDTTGETPSSSASESDHLVSPQRQEHSDIELPSIRKPHATRLVLEHANFTLKSQTEPVLQGITVSLPKSSCTMLAGPVGCGKSSLLRGILGEIRLSGGTVRVEDVGASIAYCDQIAWLRNISIRDNIIGPGQFDERWYASVCHACALNADISQFPLGDKSLVGSGGITLSGGQKQRVAIARALYARRAIVLLDDVFSALDSVTSRTVFNRVLGANGLLRKQGATVLLATNAVHQLPFADNIIVLETYGRIAQIGSFAELQAQDGYVRSLALKARSSHDEEDTREADTDTTTDSAPAKAAEEDESDLARQTGDRSLYEFYLKSTGLPLSLGFLLIAIGYVGISRMPTVWVRIWTEHSVDQDRGAYFSGYISFAIATVFLSGMIVWFHTFLVIPKSAKYLHWLLLDAVARAPLWYFTTTDSGTILNRFSQDMTLIDQALPMAFFATAIDSLTLVANAAIIASGAQYVAAVIPLCIAAMYFLQKYYLRTSRQLRHLDLESKSPLYTHFTETLNGVATIRAFGWQQGFQQENLRFLDQSQKPFYLLFCVQRWLNVVMDLFVTGIAIVLVSFAVEFTSTTSRGAIGLSMVTLISFNNSLSRVISSWTNMETSLGAIARLRDFIRDTPREDSVAQFLEPPESWPSTGAIQIKGLTATYHLKDETVLRDLSLRIQPGQKVGICGRTGSGKSSLLLSLLKLLETQSGSITIDGLDLASVPSVVPRTHLTVLPQDSVTLPGTVRTNLDPLETVAGDEILIDALSRAGMWETISSRGGLDVDFESLGLSHGQKQLFCLARALLSKSPVVLLDEATSSVDNHSDEQAQKVLREAFKEKTMLVVAHRLETIVDLGLVVVMEKGRIVEVGDPRELKSKPDSLFRTLWESRHG